MLAALRCKASRLSTSSDVDPGVIQVFPESGVVREERAAPPESAIGLVGFRTAAFAASMEAT